MEKDKTIRILNAVLKELNMTADELALRLGMPDNGLDPNKKNFRVSKKLASKIIEHFPQFNLSFLLTGQGDMLNIGYEKIGEDDDKFPITVSGESMAPEYLGGSQVLVKRINEKAFIDWGRAYVLDTCNGRLMKILMPPDDGSTNKVKCVSINPKYPSYEIGFENIDAIYVVIGCISLK